MGTLRSAEQFKQQVQAAGYDCHEVAPDLWVGSKPYPGHYPFDVIVLCAVEYQPDAGDFPGVIGPRGGAEQDGAEHDGAGAQGGDHGRTATAVT